MATADLPEIASAENVPVILRIKRRRNEDPANALVISHAKVAKYDDDEDCDTIDKSVFRFAGTFGKQEGEDSVVLFDKIADKITEHKSKLKYNPFANLTISEKRASMKRETQALSAQHRYQLISKKRGIKDVNFSEDNVIALGSELNTPVKDHKTDLKIYGKSASKTLESNFKDYVRQMAQFYDLEEHSLETAPKTASVQQSKADLCDTMTCNGVEMVRERVTKEKLPHCMEDQFVYDVYYSEDFMESSTEQFFDWSSLTAIKEPIFVHDIFESDEECFDDEDDSNDENNWRNDYPDEKDGNYGNSDEEGSNYGYSDNEYGQSDYSDTENQCSYRNRSKYSKHYYDKNQSISTDNWYVSNAHKLNAKIMDDNTSEESQDSLNDDFLL